MVAPQSLKLDITRPNQIKRDQTRLEQGRRSRRSEDLFPQVRGTERWSESPGRDESVSKPGTDPMIMRTFGTISVTCADTVRVVDTRSDVFAGRMLMVVL